MNFYNVRLYMYIIIFEEKAEVLDQYPLSLNPVQKADDPVQDRNRSIGPMIFWRRNDSFNTNQSKGKYFSMIC